jgi:peptide/nickel transport system substrate-binding protein
LLGLASAQTAVVMQSADPNTLDPTQNRETPTFNALLNIYDALLFKNPDGTFAPSLAESWTATSDTTWEFTLRQGVTASTTARPSTPRRWSTPSSRIQDEEAASPIAGGFGFIAEAVADWARTSLAHHHHAAHPAGRALLQRDADRLAHGLRGGRARAPSRAERRWAPDPTASSRGRATSSSCSAPSTDHWRGAPAVREVVFRPVPEAITRYSALAAGEADW